jgi:TonB-dependent starch-binding outer membrane protein SusC
MRKLYGLLTGLFMLVMQAAMAQDVTVSGKVTEANGTPVSNASVKEKGTKNGTTADAAGNFSLKVKSGATLVISSIGYEPKEVAVTGADLGNISLAIDAKALTEVVVTGTGTATSKKKVAFAVESIGADKLPQAPTVDVGSALVGKVAGAQISQVNGSPGSPVQILLRGINSSTKGTAPMILLDGVQVLTGLESLDLNSIEKVEIIQGAASGTIYGAQGANGVIQLFSKKGKQGKLNINVSSSWSSNELLNIGNVNKSKFHAFAVNGNNEVTRSNGALLTFDPLTASYLNNPVFNLIDPNSKSNKAYDKNLLWYDHYKMFFQTANIFNNSVNISSAGNKFDFSFVLTDSRQETVFKNNGDFSRTNLSLNLGVELAPGLKLRSTTQIVNTISTLLDPTGRNMFYAINNSRPFANYEQRDAAGLHSPYFGDAVGVNGYNFNYIAENAKVKDQTWDVLQNFNLNYKFAKFVELDVKYGVNRTALNSRYEIAEQSRSEGAAYWEYWAEYYSPRTSYGVPTVSSESGEINQGDYVTNFQNFNANAFIVLDWQKDFNFSQPITSSTQVGWDYRKTNYDELINSGTDAPDITPYRMSNMANFRTQSDFTEQFTTYGVLVNQRFDYGNYGGFSAGFRSDYSSAFGKGATPFTFPRGDAYVRISSFGFWQNSDISNTISEWKIRAAHGAAGIQPGAYERFPVLTGGNINGQSVLSSLVTGRNPNLSVIVSRETEYGTDINFELGKNNWFKGAKLSFTYWSRKSEDVIDQVDVAPSLGSGRASTNAMTLASNGIQASLNMNMYSSKDLNWNMTVNFARQNSVIESVAANAELIKQSAAGSSQYVLRAGEQIGQIYGYLFLNSVDQKDAAGNFFIPAADHGLWEVASNGYVVNKTTKQPYATANRFALGDANPDFNMSFINELNYKGIVSLDIQWDWIQGSNLYNQTKQWMYRDGIHQDYATPITINGQTEAWSAFYRGAYAVRQANGTKSYFMEDASFWRLRNIAIGVDLNKIFKVKAFTKMQVVLSGRNLVTFTKYTGMDPEVSSGTNNSSFDRAVDHNTIPNLKSYQVALNLGF